MPRGNIQSTNFKAQISNFRYDEAADAKAKKEKAAENVAIDNKTKKCMRQIYDVFGDRFEPAFVRRALKVCNLDVEEAISWLEHHGRKVKKPHNSGLASGLSSRQASPPARQVPSTPPKPARRRLMQGLKKRNSPAQSQPSQTLPAPSSGDEREKEIIVLDDDVGDTYKAESSPAPSESGNEKVLTCMNESDLGELAAMTGLKKEQLEIIVDHRPFRDLAQARAVSIARKPGSRGRSRDNIGDTVVDAVEVFLNAVSAIDEVVTTCEEKARTVKSVMDRWDVDSFGHSRPSRRSTPNAELPPTPTSCSDTKLSRPPIPQQPQHLDGHCEMKPFQLFGLNWMSLLYNYDIGCILADEMGLGKTCQVISFIAHLVEDFAAKEKGDRPWPNLIVVPPSTYDNWLVEFEKFAPELSVIGYRGSQAERSEIAYEIANNRDEYHAVLATYSQINNAEDIEAMQSFNLNAAIFDEGHKMKNPKTKIYNDLKRITASWKMLLTGTPVQNNLLEMTSLLNFINPTMFDGYMESIQYIFSQKVTIRNVKNGAFLYSERVKRARTILEPFILQRRKDQVLSDMPKKISTVVHCDMTPAQKATYDDYEALFRLAPSQREKQNKGRGNDVNNVWIQLRKAAIHPLLFRRHFTDAKTEEMGRILMQRLDQEELQQPNLGHLIQELKNESDFVLHLWCRDYPRLLSKFDIPDKAEHESGKVTKLLELISQYQENGDRVLVFSKFSRVVELLREVLTKLEIPHLDLQGSTGVDDRQTLIDQFNSDPSIPVFLLTTGAGGTGINLTAANKVIIFDQSDNPQEDIQAENRAHRLGQTRDVEIIRLLSRGTIEELIYEACQKKIELAEKVTGKSDEEATLESENMETRVRKMMKEQLTPP